jgi:hypothetical protein
MNMGKLAPVALSVGLLGIVGGVAAASAFQSAPKPVTHLVQPAAQTVTVTPSPTTTTAAGAPRPVKVVKAVVAPAPVQSTQAVAPAPAPVQQKAAPLSTQPAAPAPTDPTPVDTTTVNPAPSIAPVKAPGAGKTLDTGH